MNAQEIVIAEQALSMLALSLETSLMITGDSQAKILNDIYLESIDELKQTHTVKQIRDWFLQELQRRETLLNSMAQEVLKLN